jgi:hypothetical protein
VGFFDYESRREQSTPDSERTIARLVPQVADRPTLLSDNDLQKRPGYGNAGAKPFMGLRRPVFATSSSL